MSGVFDNIDIDTIGEYAINGISSVKKSIASVFNATAQYDATDTFRAVVLTNPTTISHDEAAAYGYTNVDSAGNRSYNKFKVRIVSKNINPHRILADPCDISSTSEPCLQNALIAAHTTIVTRERSGIQVGSLVEVRLDKDKNKNFNLQFGHLTKTYDNNTTGTKVLSAEACARIQMIYDFGDKYVAAPPIKISSEVRELAEAYDEFGLVTNKSQHKKYLFGDGPPAVAKPFDMFFKAFIQKVMEQTGISIHITSGWRTVQQQERLHADYKAGRRTLPAACGTCSRHINGAAIDLNLILPDGTWITSKTLPKKTSWEDTNVVKIAKSLGLKWGGDFTKYDPVHFEYVPVEWGSNADIAQIFKQQRAGSQPPRYDTTDTGLTRDEEKERIKETPTDEPSEVGSFLDSTGDYEESDAGDWYEDVESSDSEDDDVGW